MNDFDIFLSELENYNEKCNDCSSEKRKELFDDLFLKIKDLNCDYFKLYYYKARYLNGKNQLDEARNNIDRAIELMESKCSISIDKLHIDGIFDLNVFRDKNKLISDVYSCAGEIYAKIDEIETSVKYYKICQYYNSFLESDFKDYKHVSVFSFRKYNENSLSDLINNTITVCPSSKMNDPFDSIINLWGDTDNLEKICTDKKHIMPMCSAFNLYRIRSFCLGNRNTPIKKVLMWSHYAGEHTGFCIKYKLSNHFIKQKENGNYEHMYLKKIEYTNEKISIATTSINTDVAFATKSKEWRYENEVRLIVYNPNKTEQFYGIELDDESEIEAIFFGYRCSEVAINTIKNIFINKNAKVPKFYKMILDENNVYNLKYEVVK